MQVLNQAVVGDGVAAAQAALVSLPGGSNQMRQPRPAGDVDADLQRLGFGHDRQAVRLLGGSLADRASAGKPRCRARQPSGDMKDLHLGLLRVHRLEQAAPVVQLRHRIGARILRGRVQAYRVPGGYVLKLADAGGAGIRQVLERLCHQAACVPAVRAASGPCAWTVAA